MIRRGAIVVALALAAACHDTRIAPSYPGGHVVVLSKETSVLSLIAPNSGRLEDRFDVGHAPHEVAISRDGRYAVVADYGDRESAGHTLTVIDLVNRRRDSTIDLAPHERPHGIVFLDRRSTVLVTSETSAAVLQVAIRSGAIERVFATGGELSHMVALAPDARSCFTANMRSGTVSRIDLTAAEPYRTTRVGQEPEGIAVTRDGTEVWVGLNREAAVVVLDAATLATKGRVEGLAHPIRVAVAPDDRTVLVSCADTGEVAFVDRATRTVRSRLALAEAGEPNPVPIGIAIDADRRHAFVSLAAIDRVAALDLATERVLGRYEVAGGPDGIGWCFQRDPEPFDGFDRR